MQFKSVVKIGVAFLAIAFSQYSFAGGYWAIGGGVSSWDIKPLFGSVEVKNGPTLDILLGSRTGNFAFEGEFTFSSHDWVGYSNATHNAGNLIIAGVGFVPVSPNFEFYGKLGLDYWRTTVDYGGYNYDGDTGLSLVLGAGMKMIINQGFDLRFEYKRMNGLGDGVDKGDIGQATVLAQFNF